MATETSQEEIQIGFKAAIKILERWSANAQQCLSILSIPEELYTTAKSHENTNQYLFNPEQITRVSLILNIHSSLRTLFDNPENLYGFMTMVNKNGYFKGGTPLGKISTGKLEDLENTFNHIESKLV